MDDEYVASYSSAVLPVLEWVTTSDWMETYMGHDAEFYGELVQGLRSPVEDILGLLPHPLFARAERCCFDDFLISEYDSTPSNPLDQYLAELGADLVKADFEFLTAFRTSVVRVYHVEERVPYESVTLRDLSGGARPIQIEDEQLTAALSAGDKVATRILTIGERDYLAGPVLVLAKDAFEAFQQAFEEQFKEQIRGIEKYLQKDPRQRSLARQRVLKGAASVISGMWVASTLATLEKAMPDATEEDPEALFYGTMPYALPIEPIISCLDAQPELNRPIKKEFLWLWYADRTSPAAGLKAIVWIWGPEICIESWDADRIEEAVAAISALLGDAVGEARIEEFGDDDDEQPPMPVPFSGEEESSFRDRIHKWLDNRLLANLDCPVRGLKERVPRELAKTVKGRKQLSKWLEGLEAHLRANPDQVGLSDYDLGWMWKELGIEGHRQSSLFE